MLVAYRYLTYPWSIFLQVLVRERSERRSSVKKEEWLVQYDSIKIIWDIECSGCFTLPHKEVLDLNNLLSHLSDLVRKSVQVRKFFASHQSGGHHDTSGQQTSALFENKEEDTVWPPFSSVRIWAQWSCTLQAGFGVHAKIQPNILENSKIDCLLISYT